jgi:putative ABC transport system permease protein
MNLVSNLIADMRYGARVLARSPGFALVAVAALALGIGANTSVFSVIEAVLLRPLPYKDPSKLAFVWEDASFVGFPKNTPAPANFVDWKTQNTVFSNMAALRGRSMNLTGDGAAEYVRGNAVTPEFFGVMGVPALIGRTLDDRDDKSGDNTVVISHSLWQRRYAGDPAIAGRQLKLSDESYTVVGVMPNGFRFPHRRTDFWIPAKFTPEQLARRGSHFLTVVARLKPGVTWDRAQAEMDTIAKRLQQDYPNTNERVGAVVVPINEEIAGDSKTGLIVLLAGAGFVLLIACANVANLLLARAAARQRELAVRTALGAGRGRLITQLITESVLLSSAGGLIGLALARGGLTLLERLVPQRLDRTLTLNSDVLLFSLAVSIATGIIFGVLPALHASRLDLNDALKQGGRSNAGGRGGLYRDALVVAEVAMALVLLAGAGLMMKTLARLQAIDVGFKPEGLLAVSSNIPHPKYADPQKRLRHYESVLEEVRSLPGVRGAAFVSDLPFTTEGNTNGFRIEGKPERPGGPAQDALYRLATNDYLKTLDVRLLEGRLPDERDGQSAPPVLVINETFARTFFDGESPLGKRIDYGEEPWRTIIGVIADVRERGIKPSPKAAMYIPLAQDLDGWAVADDLLVRTDGDPLAIAAAVRAAIHHSDPDLPIVSVQTMQEILDLGVATRQQQMRLLMAFAGLALTLAGLGIYGVLSYLVVQRSREIGLRMALGASASDIVRSVAGKGALLTGAGLAIGTGAALAITRAMRSMLYEVAPADASTYAAVIATLMLIGLIACAVPAMRAARVDPMVALRDE